MSGEWGAYADLAFGAWRDSGDVGIAERWAKVAAAVQNAMRADGYVKLPAEWYIAEDGDGDPSIWMPLPENDKHHDWDKCIGVRMMAGNARVEKPVADWLWENVRKGES